MSARAQKPAFPAPCGDPTTAQDDAVILERTTIVTVAPTNIVDTCSGTWQVSGTKLLLRPPEGVSPERLARVFECHRPRAVFVGSERGAADDLDSMSDERIEIETKPDAGQLTVTLGAGSVAKNIRLLRRTEMFAQMRLTPRAQ
jgi:hypothetical protein